MDKFKADFNDSFEAICTNAEGASEALQQGYALLEEVGDDLRPAARRKLEAAVNKLEADGARVSLSAKKYTDR